MTEGLLPLPRRTQRALLACLAVAALGCATTVHQRSWLETRSEHFTIYSTLPRAETEALAVDLEVFRAAVVLFTNARTLDSPIPIEIFVFRSLTDLRRFTPGRNVGGFIRPTPRSYQVLLGASEGMGLDGRLILYHEYVHFLVRNESAALLPRWYDEGFAEFLSTAEREEDRLVVGKPDPDRAAWLVGDRPMRVEQMLDPAAYVEFSPRQVARFYAWSWLLVHFLSWDYEDPEGVGFHARFEVYLREVGRGRPPEEAIESAWGLTPAELDEMLARTVSRGVKTGSLPLARLDYSDEVGTRTVSAAEMARRLGAAALTGMDLDHARELFQAALAAAPGDARATAGLADTYKFEERMEEAEPLFERAVALDPTDPLNLLDRAEYWLDRARRAEDPEAKDALARKALAAGRAALALDPGNPEAIWVNGFALSLLAEPDLEESLRVLRQAAAILPADEILLYSLLEVYVAAGRDAEAERVAHRLMGGANSREEIEKIQQMLEGGGPEP